MSALTIMKMEQFAEEIKRRVHALLQVRGVDVADILIGENKKNNITLTALQPVIESCRVVPNIYLETFHELYCEEAKEDVDVELLRAIAGKIVSMIQDELKPENGVLADVYIDALSKKEGVLGNVYPALVGREGNEKFLEGKVWRAFLDMAIYYRVCISVAGIPDASCVLKTGHIERLGLTEVDLYQAAIKNAAGKFEVTPILNILSELEDSDGAWSEMADDVMQTFCFDMAIVKINNVMGASAILVEEKMRQLAEEHNVDSIWVLPSSVHDCMLVFSQDEDVEFLRAMVKNVNEKFVEAEDKLTDSVYVYRVSDGISIAS